MPAAAAARPIPWAMLGTLSKLIGFALFFIGVLIAVSFGTPGGGCYSSPGSCTITGTGAQIVNAVLVGKILVVLGLSGLAAGAGVKLHWGHKPAAGEDSGVFMAEYRFNGLLFLISVLTLLLLLLTVNILPNVGGLGGL